MKPGSIQRHFRHVLRLGPWVVGVAIYLTLYFAKRREIATSNASATQTTGSQTSRARNAAAAARATKWYRKITVAPSAINAPTALQEL